MCVRVIPSTSQFRGRLVILNIHNATFAATKEQRAVNGSSVKQRKIEEITYKVRCLTSNNCVRVGAIIMFVMYYAKNGDSSGFEYSTQKKWENLSNLKKDVYWMIRSQQRTSLRATILYYLMYGTN